MGTGGATGFGAGAGVATGAGAGTGTGTGVGAGSGAGIGTAAGTGFSAAAKGGVALGNKECSVFLEGPKKIAPSATIARQAAIPGATHLGVFRSAFGAGILMNGSLWRATRMGCGSVASGIFASGILGG
jgi:hypothetical protein